MKTAELSGNALDWAVAMCEDDKTKGAWTLSRFKPSTDWAAAGPIIERERIAVRGWDGEEWVADIRSGFCEQFGATPLIAAMRCYVASKLGDKIKLPEGLSC